MSQCKAKTTKKAWSNPLAPMAKCTREAVADGLCVIHSPAAKLRREEASRARWLAEVDREKKQRERENAAHELAASAPSLLARAEKAESQRDRLRAALERVEVEVSSNEGEPDDVLSAIGRAVRAALEETK